MCRKLHLDIGAELPQNRMALLDNSLVERDAVQSCRYAPIFSGYKCTQFLFITVKLPEVIINLYDCAYPAEFFVLNQ